MAKTTRTHLPLTLIVCLLAALAGSLAFGSGSASAAVESFRNSTPISLPGNGSASPYPSTINAPAMEGLVTGVTVTFHGFSHGSPRSVNALLVAPDGKKSLVMTGSCGYDVPSTTFIFSDSGPGTMPAGGPCDKIVYRPTENTPDGWVSFGTNVPAGPYSANFNNFLGSPSYGAWKLYIKGYGGAESGKIAGGWSLTLQTANPDALVPGVGAFSGKASSYPLKRTVSGLDGRLITDVNVSVPGVYHQNAADLEMMLVGPRGHAAILMSDSCPGDVRYEYWAFDDESNSFMGVEQPCPSGTYRPVGRTDQYFPEVSLVGPGTQTALSNFDLTEPNGDWALYVYDDHPYDGYAGLFLNRFDLQIQTRPKAALQFASPTLEVDEGTSGELTVTRSAGGEQTARASLYLTFTPGSAGADDFKQATVSVDFAPGETEKQVRFDALADAVSDPDETFDVKFGYVSGDAIPAGATTATVKIRDVAPAGDEGPTDGPTGGGDGPAPDLAAPQISGLTLAPKRFGVSLRRTARVARVPRGTKIRYALSEAATVTLRFERAVARRPSGRRWVRVGTLRRTGSAGANRVAFSGRIGRRALRPGLYRLIVRATDAAGNSATAKPRTLRVVP